MIDVKSNPHCLRECARNLAYVDSTRQH